MARPKEFDKEEVLQKAVSIFWCKGYEATSMQDLVDGMGIKRQSLYDTFSDKHTLYLSALSYYRADQEKGLAALIASNGTIKEKLGRFFDRVIEESMTDKTRRGCFMNNAMAEMITRDERTFKIAAEHVKHVEQAWTRAFIDSQKKGEVSKKHDPVALARYFFNAINGLRLIAKTTMDEKVLRDTVNITLSVLD